MKRYSWRADIDDYGPLIGEEAMARILAKAYRLRGMRVLHVSSTFYGSDVTTHALPRPPPASGTSVDHVPVHTFVHSLSCKSKDTRGIGRTPRVFQRRRHRRTQRQKAWR
jgi:hypothetical protein